MAKSVEIVSRSRHLRRSQFSHHQLTVRLLKVVSYSNWKKKSSASQKGAGKLLEGQNLQVWEITLNALFKMEPQYLVQEGFQILWTLSYLS